jgi:hypothetical protein
VPPPRAWPTAAAPAASAITLTAAQLNFLAIMISPPNSSFRRKPESMNTDRRDFSTSGLHGSRIKGPHQSTTLMGSLSGMTGREPYRLRKVFRKEPLAARNGTFATLFSLDPA